MDVDVQDVLQFADVLDHTLDDFESVQLLFDRGLAPGRPAWEKVSQFIQVNGHFEILLPRLGHFPAPDGGQGVHGGLTDLRLHGCDSLLG